MTFNSAGENPRSDWLLTAHEGNLSVRVRDRLAIGLDDGGELALNPRRSQAELLVSAGQVTITATGDGELRSAAGPCHSWCADADASVTIHLGPQTLRLKNTMLGRNPVTQSIHVVAPPLERAEPKEQSIVRAAALKRRPVAPSVTESTSPISPPQRAPRPADRPASPQAVPTSSQAVPTSPQAVPTSPQALPDSPQALPDSPQALEADLMDLIDQIPLLSIGEHGQRIVTPDAIPVLTDTLEMPIVVSEPLFTVLPEVAEVAEVAEPAPAIQGVESYPFPPGRRRVLGAVPLLLLMIGITLVSVSDSHRPLLDTSVQLPSPPAAAVPQSAGDADALRLLGSSSSLAEPLQQTAPEIQTTTVPVPASAPINLRPEADEADLALPGPDPYQTEIAEAERLIEADRIIEPLQHNAVKQLASILHRDPTHAEALNLMQRAADRLLAAASTARAQGDVFEARNLAEEVLAFHPTHPGARMLWDELLEVPNP